MKTAQPILGRKLAILAAALLLIAAFPRVGWAQGSLETRVRVSNEKLDSTRGGFDTNSMVLSIGISRAVFINDKLVITTTLNIPGFNANSLANSHASLTSQLGAGANPDGLALGTLALPVVTINGNGMSLIQNGPNNTAVLQNLPSAGSIIQNTLDNQAIRSLTTIDAKVLSQNIARSLNATTSMRDMFTRSGR
jgi:hypothetical protein